MNVCMCACTYEYTNTSKTNIYYTCTLPPLSLYSLSLSILSLHTSLLRATASRAGRGVRGSCQIIVVIIVIIMIVIIVVIVIVIIMIVVVMMKLIVIILILIIRRYSWAAECGAAGGALVHVIP